MVRALLALGDEEQGAAGCWPEVPPKLAEHAEVTGARSALALAAEGRRAQKQMKAMERRLAADPADHEARYELATALNAAGQRAEAADALLEIARHDRAWREDAARLQLLKFFEAWGFDDPADHRRTAQAFSVAVPVNDDPNEVVLPTEFPVFPLAGALLLPHGRLPLNIFEPRYIAMVDDSLGAGRVFGMIQPNPRAASDEHGQGLYRVRLPRAADQLFRDRRWPLPDHADRAEPLRSRRRTACPARLPPRAGELRAVP